VKLRPYQLDSIEKIRARIRSGDRRVVLVMPTGGGKTVVASKIIRSAIGRGSRILFLAHRKELIDQTHAKLARFCVAAGVLMGTDKRRDDFQPVQIASVATLVRRLDRLPPADLVIVDECHHAASDSYKKILNAYPNAVILGLTATPWRSDKIGLADLYDSSVLAASVAELMEIGALVRYDAYAYDAPDLHEVGIVAGEFNQKDLALACNTSILVGSVVREYLAHAQGRRAILFPVNIEHSQSLVGEFRSFGIAAEHVDCDTPKTDRERILGGLASGAVTVVSSVGVLTEGFDCPAAEVCILARPTKSLTLHLQMIGRVLRPSAETGKLRALIHDHAGNLIRHGFPEDERDYALTATSQRVRDLHTCPLCFAVFGSLKDGRCPGCGEAIAAPPEPRAESGGRNEKETVEGARISAEQIRRMRERGVREDLTDRQLARAAKSTTEEKASEFRRLLDVAARKGFSEGWAKHAYRETFGVWPRFPEGVLESTEPAPRPFFPLPKRSEAA
jgi:DNA repair protein RadD